MYCRLVFQASHKFHSEIQHIRNAFVIISVFHRNTSANDWGLINIIYKKDKNYFPHCCNILRCKSKHVWLQDENGRAKDQSSNPEVVRHSIMSWSYQPGDVGHILYASAHLNVVRTLYFMVMHQNHCHGLKIRFFFLIKEVKSEWGRTMCFLQY